MNMKKHRRKKIVIITLILTGLFLYSFKLKVFPGKVNTIYINEVCPKNLSVVSDSQGKYPSGWIELYNAGTEDVNLEGYHLSNKRDRSYDDILPKIRIEGGGFVLVYVGGRIENELAEGESYLDIKLDKGHQSVFLLNPAGELIDQIELPENLPVNTSYGRTEQDGNLYGAMTCSPGVSNAASKLMILPALDSPVLSADSGFYQEPFYLSMSAKEGGENIYYTLDGSIPGLESNLYEEPLLISDASLNNNVFASRVDFSALPYYIPETPIDKATIVRAAVINEDGNRSEIVTKTYFVDHGEEYGGSIPTLSLISEPNGLFGYTEGIFVLGKEYDDFVTELGKEPEVKENYRIEANFNGKGREWEREAILEYYENGKLEFTQTLGIRSRGKSSSEGPQKGLNIYARQMYDGNAKLQYDIFDNGRSVERFMMKNSNSILKDGFIMSLVTDRAVAPLHYLPCSLFLDGEYWGTYTLLEKYDEQFFYDYYGIDKDNIAIMKNSFLETGTMKDYDNFYDIFSFAESNDLSVDKNYQEICSMVDIESLIDYYCIQIYIDNVDCSETYNMLAWKARMPGRSSEDADGKWHWAVYDIDASLIDATRNNLAEEIRTGRPAFLEHTLIKALLRNQEFRDKFVYRFVDMIYTNFAPETVLPKYDAAVAELKDALKRQHVRFQGGWYNDGVVEQELQQMRDFYENRGQYVLQYLQNYFELSDAEMERFVAQAKGK